MCDNRKSFRLLAVWTAYFGICATSDELHLPPKRRKMPLKTSRFKPSLRSGIDVEGDKGERSAGIDAVHTTIAAIVRVRSMLPVCGSAIPTRLFGQGRMAHCR
jgi:hypothetical protein